MAEESKQAFDPEATVTQPLAGSDPEATLGGPIVKPEPDPEATDRHPVFDPEATVNPADRAALDPEATVRLPTPGRIRKNPFAPKGTPESIQANLFALGGLNPLIAMANPILGAVPQIRRALRHPDPAQLHRSLRNQIEGFETNASSADIPDRALAAAVYALCALLDDAAAATPWGGDWIEKGLLHEMRGESGAGEGFFAQLDQICMDPEANADLIEFFYICLALGFEGRYRKADGGRQALDQVRDRLYALISRRRPRPADGLSERWRSATAQAAAQAAVQNAAQVSAQISAQAAAHPGDEDTTLPPVRTSPRFSLSRLPRRVVWSAVAGLVGSCIVFYLLALRLLEDDARAALASRPGSRASAKQTVAAPVPPAAPATAKSSVAEALAGEAVAVTEDAGRTLIAIRHDRQFASGSTLPGAELRPLLQKIAEALDKAPGSILVLGHADARPARSARYASNAELSAARARSVARLMAPGLGDPKRLAAEGRGDSEPLAPNDTEANRARNRRVVIELRPAS